MNNTLYFPVMILLCKLGKDNIFLAVWALNIFLLQKVFSPVSGAARGMWSPAYLRRTAFVLVGFPVTPHRGVGA